MVKSRQKTVGEDRKRKSAGGSMEPMGGTSGKRCGWNACVESV